MRSFVLRNRRPVDRRRCSDGGFSLVELIVAMSILMLVLALILTIVGVLSVTTYQSLNVSQQTNSAQVSVANFQQYLDGVAPPMVAATVSFPTSGTGTPPLTTSTPCWGLSNPASGATAQSLSQPSRDSITVAHDFDMVWCGYAPQTSTASVYEATVNPTSCTGGTYGNCTLTVTNYGASCQPGIGVPGSGPTSTGCSTGNTVLSIPHVWCDTYCQGSKNSVTNQGGNTVNVACIDVPGNTSTTCANATPPLLSYFSAGNGRYNSTVNSVTLTTSTPSIATVSGTTSGFPGIVAGMTVVGANIPSGTTVVSVAAGTNATNLTMSNSYSGAANTTESLSFVGTNFQNSLNHLVSNESFATGCTNTGVALDLGQQSGATTSCMDPISYLTGIQSVTLNLTILSNSGTPGGSNAKTGNAANSSATFDNQVLLTNQVQANNSCGAATFEYPPNLTSFFPLDDAQNPMADLGQSSNGTSQTDIQMQYNTNTNSSPTLANGVLANPSPVTPGPLACNSLTAGAAQFNGSSEYAVDDYWSTATLWGTTGLTVEAEIMVPTETTAATRQRIISDGYATGTSSSNGGGIELALKPANSCGTSGNQPNGIVFSYDGGSWYTCLAAGLTAGTYFVVATVNYSATPPVNVYINGSDANEVPNGLQWAVTEPTNTAGCPLVIGATANSTGVTSSNTCAANGVPALFFNGKIADVATYSTALSPTQILTQYNELSQ